MTYRNDFDFIGRIVSEQDFNEDNVIITLSFRMQKDFYPRILCKKEDIPEYKKHSYLAVKGYADGWYTVSKNGKTLVPRLRATSVKAANTVLEEAFGIKGRFWAPKPLMLYLSGTIAEIVDDMDHMRYVIVTQEPESGEKVSVPISWRKIERHPEYKIGDEVCAACQISTPRKTVGTEDRIFLNFNVFDMDYLN